MKIFLLTKYSGCSLIGKTSLPVGNRYVGSNPAFQTKGEIKIIGHFTEKLLFSSLSKETKMNEAEMDVLKMMEEFSEFLEETPQGNIWDMWQDDGGEG